MAVSIVASDGSGRTWIARPRRTSSWLESVAKGAPPAAALPPDTDGTTTYALSGASAFTLTVNSVPGTAFVEAEPADADMWPARYTSKVTSAAAEARRTAATST